ncbi:MAG: mandelate racemase/muconate lactonizing enzyme family protein [Firmicutes bacterium]|nr:mandelate racemase/muconate lactonizing enzyme family protein [Bacillota bacterium]
MKITDVQVDILGYRCKKPVVFSHLQILQRKIILVKIFTDEGIIGIGDVDAEPTGDSVARDIILNKYKPQLIGEDPLKIGYLWEKLINLPRAMGRLATEMYALGAVDVALWDIAGKAMNQPVASLLGKYRTEVPVYASWSYLTLEELPEKMEETLEKNFKATKIRIGVNPEIDEKLVATARNILGDECRLMVDVNSGWSRVDAERNAYLLEKYNLDWIEEPIDSSNIEGYRNLAARIRTPIAMGEHQNTRQEFRDLLLQEAADVYQPDIRAGGITECKKIVDMVNTWGFKAVPHCYGSGLKGAATLQLIGAISGPTLFELNMNEDPLRTEIIREDVFTVKDGKIKIPEGPGLGVSLDENSVRKYLQD